ncbi:RRQRL motif-containing zinc-binding protein [Lentzea sp. BCCO 10_0798]|uniref:RRQRL motif-containing zinc-binding protein n=1 Tax=Lentzea kristufekii TaxID=3095430 RepID=A0ABU4U5G2_9PSEU|nr:RRQRL motif-containing zinc-binding protein [Lentzea sp. BCCO 10_0798]MDX8055751.1 RRQRL motif-containing zinc-binding protein [Lentzea sp. BCCO 10_0798]
MGRRQYPWVLATVAWSDAQQYTRGTLDGLPLLSHGCAPRDVLATRRQLRALGLRPGGADPVAVLYGRHNRSKARWFASLYLIARAVPVRPMTPAKHTALAKANLARRICRTCGRDPLYVLPRSTRQCWPCFELTHDTDDLTEAA